MTHQALAAVLIGLPWLVVAGRGIVEAARVGAAREAVGGIAGVAGALATHFHAGAGRCPGAAAEAGPTPALDVTCARGRGGRCRPTDAPSRPGDYPADAWQAEPLWREIAFELTEPHAFHYALAVSERPGGCDFVIGAEADLDGDGERSRIEVRGVVDARGVMFDRSWRIEQPTE